jgi:transcriptional regulator with XRE-family HTH domain
MSDPATAERGPGRPPRVVNPAVARRLIKLRRAHGLSQSDVATRLRVSEATVSRWENAVNEPDSANRRKLAHLYGVNPSYLVGLD